MLYHIVLFQFKPTVSNEEISQVVFKFLQLKAKCHRANTEESYISSSTGGTDCSIENMQHGISHAFIVEFENEKDRDYYVKEDPAHQAFVAFALPYLAKAQVVDFNKGSFAYPGGVRLD